MNSLNLRWADVEDAPGIAEVHVASWRSAYCGLIDQQVLEELSMSTRADGWKRILSKIAIPRPSEMTSHRIRVADVDERIVRRASFGAGGDKGMTGHGEKKQRVIEKLGAFFERFFGFSSGGNG